MSATTIETMGDVEIRRCVTRHSRTVRHGGIYMGRTSSQVTSYLVVRGAEFKPADSIGQAREIAKEMAR